ncbi:MAG: hypothetical protein LPL00_08600 [Alphaproteobacteria bacterium]|nr:hypothetical protein [Alphaproteobacteria bacterium]MDX5369671.1 hypothetical protein [Alphaproteobacteria bacterium]MDX5464306.1 hypothetical protein [Alphaproteobacteria bacterium]
MSPIKTEETGTQLLEDLTPARVDALVREGRALQARAVRTSLRNLWTGLKFSGRKDYVTGATTKAA